MKIAYNLISRLHTYIFDTQIIVIIVAVIYLPLNSRLAIITYIEWWSKKVRIDLVFASNSQMLTDSHIISLCERL